MRSAIAILYDIATVYKPDIRVDTMRSTGSLYQQIPLSSDSSTNAFSRLVKIVGDKIIRYRKTRVDDESPFDGRPVLDRLEVRG